MSNRFEIYWYDFFQKGPKYFFLSRLKKRPLFRKIVYLFKPDFIVLGGRKFYVNKMDTVVSESLITNEVWEPLISQIFSKYAKNKKLILDLGAQIGYYTRLASLASPNANIIAFEPAPDNFSLLTKNKLPGQTLENFAVAAKSGRGKIFLNSENFGDNRVYKNNFSSASFDINFVSLDDYFKKDRQVIDLIKMDVQGFEMQVLLGAKHLLKNKKIKIILSELWPEGLAQVKNSWKQYLSLLKKSGFEIFEIDEVQKSIEKISPAKIQQRLNSDPHFVTNLLAISQSKIS